MFHSQNSKHPNSDTKLYGFDEMQEHETVKAQFEIQT